MNKNDLINAVCKSAKLTKKDATAAVEGVINAIGQSLKKKDKVSLIGFGTFSIAHRKATTGRNPRTGVVLKIAAKNVPKFTAGKKLKDMVK